MLISFFNLTDYTTWVDYSSYPECIHQEECTHDLSLFTPILVESEESWERSILYVLKKTPEETPIEKHTRIKNSIVKEEELSSVELEWETFSDIEIWDIITARIFAGNPYTQAVLQAKYSKAMFRKIAWSEAEEDDAIIAKAEYVNQKVNEIRRVFGLSDM